MADRIRIGICGAGSFGTTRAKSLGAIEGAEVTLGWSRSAESRARLSQETGATVVTQWRDLCTSPDVDAVFVCTPNADHFDHARVALQARKHVFVETPLSVGFAQARELADLAACQGRVLHHGAKWRYHPEHSQLIAQFRRIGHLLFAIDHSSFDFGPSRLWYCDPKLTGGARVFLPYVMLNWLETFGDATAAVGAESEKDGWQSASITLTFAAGGHATLSYALGLGIPEFNVRQAVGSEGTILALPGSSPVLIQGQSRTPLTQRQVDIVAYECRAFINEMRGLRDHRAELALDLRALRLVDQAFGVT